ncbi:hypothetical protein KUCAC02_007206 [Chaenocephalus aceratus]|uniref:Uncharacterized protein n=1 Tax=Chaenocephalus aceratus TaxID=36190 RepID=A0ACB9X6J8_CHAAC|nr:hypothetical protein KUCAC02_007206 [Chaenocephalus aceratus]
MSMCRSSSSSTGYNTPPLQCHSASSSALVNEKQPLPQSFKHRKGQCAPKQIRYMATENGCRCRGPGSNPAAFTTVITEDSPRPSPVQDRFP